MPVKTFWKLIEGTSYIYATLVSSAEEKIKVKSPGAPIH